MVLRTLIEDISITVTKQAFKGKATSNTASNGTVEVGLLITSESLKIAATVVIKAALTGTKTDDATAAVAASANPVPAFKGPQAVAEALAAKLLFPLKLYIRK